MSSLSIPPTELDLYARLPESVRLEIRAWLNMLDAIRPPLEQAFHGAARHMGVSVPTVKRKFYAVQKTKDWKVLINRAKAPEEREGLPEEFLGYWQALCESYQRKTRPAYRELKRRWQKRESIPGYAGHPNWPYLPHGWSERNLYRHLPSRFHLSLARHGDFAASSHRPLVITTRRGLWTGSHLMFDDVWHDHFVLDGTTLGRPLDLGCMDYASGFYLHRGGKIRRDGDGLKDAEMRLFYVTCLLLFGYHPERGTTLVTENRTASINAHDEALLSDMTGGMIKVSRSSLATGRSKATSHWGAAKGGNPRHKAALESFHNLLHNELADLPAQAGMNRDARPEQTAALLRYVNDLVAAGTVLDQDRAALLQWPILTRTQWESTIDERLKRINGRTDHDLEGWDDHVTIDPLTLQPRYMSPAEVYARGRSQLKPIPEALAASILYADLFQVKKVHRRTIEVSIPEVGRDDVHYDAAVLNLPEGDKFEVVANPFDPSRLWCYAFGGKFLGVLPRVHRSQRDDADALHRQMGRVEKAHTEMVAPYRARHARDTKARLDLMQHNTDVIRGTLPEDKTRARAKSRAAATIGQDGLDTLLPTDGETEIPVRISEQERTTFEEAEQLLDQLLD